MIGGDTKSTDGDVSGSIGGIDLWVIELGAQTSISESSPVASSELHPNPTKKEVRINLEQKKERIEARLLDLRGRTIQTRTVRSVRKFRMELQGKPGLYLIELKRPDGRKEMLKVVKE